MVMMLVIKVKNFVKIVAVVVIIIISNFIEINFIVILTVAIIKSILFIYIFIYCYNMI